MFTISNSRPLKTKIHPKLPFQISQDLVQTQIYKCNISECVKDKNQERISIFHPHSLLSTSFSHFRGNFPNAPKFHRFRPQNSFHGASMISYTISLETVKMKMMVSVVLPATYSPLVAIVFMGLDHRQVNNKHGC